MDVCSEQQIPVSGFFYYFQIASVVVFLLIVTGRVIHMRTRRHINPIVIGGGKRGIQLVVELLAFAGLVAWLIEILLYALHADFRIFPPPLSMQLFDSNAAKIVGAIFITVGLSIFAMAFISFGDSWRVGFDVKTPGALVTTGIFAFSRNPIYVFLDLWFLGIFLINGTLIFLIYAALTVPVIHWQIFQEERFLLRLFGQAYQDYCAQTGRYLGWRRN